MEFRIRTWNDRKKYYSRFWRNEIMDWIQLEHVRDQ